MLDVINKGPPTDGGYPVDSDLHQMSDDACPLTPDPARWSDPEWRDDPAEGRRPTTAGGTTSGCGTRSPTN